MPCRCNCPTSRPYDRVVHPSKALLGEEAGDKRQGKNDNDDCAASLSLTPAQISLNAYVNKIKAELQEKGVVWDTQEGRACVGEPSVDPSKMIAPNQGDSEWMDDW
jgi:hypothetical protein